MSRPSATNDRPSAPGPDPADHAAPAAQQHAGVIMTGADGGDGPKAFYIHIEALPGKQDDVVEMLEDILRCVNDEPDTEPWYAVRYSDTVFGIFEKFSGIAGRQAHIDGGGGDIFRDITRLNALLASPAHVYKLDVLLSKQTFAD